MGFYRDDIILRPIFGNSIIGICIGPSWVTWKIFVRAQNNLWGLYGKYLWESKLGDNMRKYLDNMWEVFRKYLCELKMVYGLV